MQSTMPTIGTSPTQTTEIARKLRDAYTSGIPVAPVRDSLPVGDVTTAYAVQKVNTEHWLQQGRRLVGRKIGLTSKVVQKQLGVDQPDFGMLFADMALCDGDEAPPSSVMQPKVEAEVALVLERDLPESDATITEVISAVAYAVPAIEIVGSRIRNWDIRLVDTIADNASAGLFVLGATPVKLNGLDLRLCGMVMERRGDQVSIGAGAACLGNPLNAAAWLARTMVEVGAPLKAGDVIMTGALGPMVQVAPADVICVRISGLGSVRVGFAG
jgi:2-keto-4-pentenoate hydratase